MTKPIPPSVKEDFCLDPRSISGLSRKDASGNPIPCGWLQSNGYWKVGYKRSRYYVHRICYYLKTGLDPLQTEIDHVDGDTKNNNPENLRAVSVSANQANQRLRDQNSSGRKGVSWHKARGKWRAQITVDKSYIHLGLFDRLENAAQAYDAAAIKFFGNHAKTNTSILNA
jgi:hypothetical protein